MATLPKLRTGSNEFPGKLIQIAALSGERLYVPCPQSKGQNWVDNCFLIDDVLGIYGREYQVDTVFLHRDFKQKDVVFLEY